jgi:predicted nuclease with TOPRIM domain
MTDSTLILRMNLLSEFIEKDLKKGEDHLKEKISALFKELGSCELTGEEEKTLEDLKESYQNRLKRKLESPLDEVRRKALKRAFLKYRGLVFDLKTRFDYSSAEVAIQDGLDLSEYVKEVIEEITNELNDSLVVESEKLSFVRDEISSYYFKFSRERLQELYPQISQTFRTFREVLDELNIEVS